MMSRTFGYSRNTATTCPKSAPLPALNWVWPGAKLTSGRGRTSPRGLGCAPRCLSASARPLSGVVECAATAGADDVAENEEEDSAAGAVAAAEGVGGKALFISSLAGFAESVCIVCLGAADRCQHPATAKNAAVHHANNRNRLNDLIRASRCSAANQPWRIVYATTCSVNPENRVESRDDDS